MTLINWATHVLQYFLQKDAIMKIGANLEKKIERFLSREHILAEMETNLSKARKAYDQLAEELSQKRKAIFSSVEQQVNQHCHD